jgi:glycosyltransferase involved in cell wall biosynthesis
VKIVQLCGWYFPESLGGTETYVAALSDHLRAGGHDVRIAAPDPGGRDERSYEYAGVPVFRYPISDTPTRPEARQEQAVRGAEQLHRWLARLRPDVVHIHTFVTGVGPYEIAAAKAAGARVIVTTHSGALGFLCQRGSMMRWGSEPCDGRVTPVKCSACVLQERGVPPGVSALLAHLPPAAALRLERLPGRLGTALGLPALITGNRRRQRQMLATADVFVVLTDWARRAVLADTPADTSLAPVVVNRLGVRTPPRRMPRGFGTPIRVAYVGRFDEVKGIHDLARAVRALPAHLPVRVEFRGPMQSDRDRASVEELRRTAAGDPRIVIGAGIEPDDVYDYLQSIDLLCCPSRTLEGGPTIALEAMAVGVPVVATRLGAMAEVLTDGVNGRLLPPGDAEALAGVLRAVIADPAGTIGRWRAALPPVRTMQDVAQDYVRLYLPASPPTAAPALSMECA